MTVRPTTLNLEAVKRAHLGSVLTHGDSDWADDVDRFSVSGMRGKLGWYPITASSKKPSTTAMVKLRWFLHSLELVKAWVCDNTGTGFEVWTQCRGDEGDDTTDPVL